MRFDPAKRRRLIGKAPGLDELERMLKHRPCYPSDSTAVRRCELADRHGLELVERHRRIMLRRMPNARGRVERPDLEMPRRVGIDRAKMAARELVEHGRPRA